VEVVLVVGLVQPLTEEGLVALVAVPPGQMEPLTLVAGEVAKVMARISMPDRAV
jgi:hypothetical protein